MTGACGADSRWAGGEIDVCKPVSYAPAAAEAQDDELVGCVCCDEASYVCCEAVFEFGERVCVCGLDARAVSLGAGDFSIGGVVVAETVGSGGVL